MLAIAAMQPNNCYYCCVYNFRVCVCVCVCGRNEAVTHVFEYQWPLNDKSAEWFVLQEHISEFLGVVSFKRKYPGKISPIQL